eukprot:scaffold16484_cov168-Skeletonema_marinoi.AAC.2
MLFVYKCIQRSVLSLGRALGRSCDYIVDLIASSGSVLLDLDAPDCHVLAALRRSLLGIFVVSIIILLLRKDGTNR